MVFFSSLHMALRIAQIGSILAPSKDTFAKAMRCIEENGEPAIRSLRFALRKGSAGVSCCVERRATVRCGELVTGEVPQADK